MSQGRILWIVISAQLFGAGICSGAYAQSSTNASQLPSDGGAVKSSDVIIWQVNKPVTLQSESSQGSQGAGSGSGGSSTGSTSQSETVCFPAGSRFDVTSVIAAAKSSTVTKAAAAGAGSTSSATPADTQLVSGHFSSSKAEGLFHPWHRDSLNGHSQGTQSPCGASTPPATYDKTYEFTSDQLTKQEFYRQGFTWGGLVVPYKFYFTDHTIKSNSSVVGFAGYQGWFPGVSLAGVIAAGGGTAPSSSSSTTSGTTGGSTSPSSNGSSSVVTYTVAIGFIAAFGGGSSPVKAGLMVGRDYQGNPSGFPYENKTWLALSIGAGF